MGGRGLAGALSIGACVLAAQACATVGRDVPGAVPPATTTSPAAACWLALVIDGAVVRRVALPADGSFKLRFIHSVFHTEVVERYRVRDGVVVQVGMRYQGEGYGFPDDTSARKVRDGEFTEVILERRIERLVVRARAESANRLRARDDHELVALGTRPIEITPCGCAPYPPAADAKAPCAIPVTE